MTLWVQFKPALARVNPMPSKDAKLLMLPNLHWLVRSSTHHGAVALKKRSARDAEVGRPQSPRSLRLGFRLLRPSQSTGLWEKPAVAIEAGDAITKIVPVAGGAPTVTDV